LIIAKNRHGQCTDIPVVFEGKYTKYTERIWTQKKQITLKGI
jgi:replicative DNA helicase